MIIREMEKEGPEQTSGGSCETRQGFRQDTSSKRTPKAHSAVPETEPRVAHVLIVDDSAYDALLMGNAFEEADLRHSIAMVRDGEEAMRYLSGEPPFSDEPMPDLVLLDLNMPRVDGFDVLAWARSEPRCKSVPIVMMSSSENPADEGRAKELGANDYRAKTANLDELRRFALELDRMLKG